MDILSSLQSGSNLFKKKDLNWGVLGTSRIAARELIPAINSIRYNKVLGVASRELTRAAEYASNLEIPKSYGSYDELLADPEIQVVYNPLPNDDHFTWSMRAMDAGKHVLVEKPFALNAEEAQAMVCKAQEKNLVLMEGFMYRYNSRYQKIFDLLRKGELGKLRFVRSGYSFNLTNPDDFRLALDKGGGVLYDLGCYCINSQRLLVGREPVVVQAAWHKGQSGVDLSVAATMDFGDQVYTQFTISYNASRHQYTQVVGVDAIMDIVQPFNPHGKPTSIVITRDGKASKTNFRGENDYRNLAEHFYHVVINKETPSYPLSDAVNTMAVMDAIAQSASNNSAPVALNL